MEGHTLFITVSISSPSCSCRALHVCTGACDGGWGLNASFCRFITVFSKSTMHSWFDYYPVSCMNQTSQGCGCFCSGSSYDPWSSVEQLWVSPASLGFAMMFIMNPAWTVASFTTWTQPSSCSWMKPVWLSAVWAAPGLQWQLSDNWWQSCASGDALVGCHVNKYQWKEPRMLQLHTHSSYPDTYRETHANTQTNACMCKCTLPRIPVC